MNSNDIAYLISVVEKDVTEYQRWPLLVRELQQIYRRLQSGREGKTVAIEIDAE